MEKLYPWRIGALTEVLSSCLEYGTNIDRALKSCFKSSPKLGKKDRLFITEHGYRILRNLYCYAEVDLNGVIQKYFHTAGFDTNRLVLGENGVALELENFNAQYSIANWVYREFSDGCNSLQLESVFTALNERKRAYIRVNSNEVSVTKFEKLLDESNIGFTRDIEYETLFEIDADSVVALSQTDFYNRGYFEYQDKASQGLLEHILPYTKGASSFLDLCAGEGGKSVQFAQLRGEVKRYAYDIVLDKTKRLTRRFERLKNTQCPKVLSEEELKQLGDIDLVLIDAPCSGTGTFGRLPSQKYQLTEQHYTKMQQVQRQLLNESAKKISDRGFIAYSTCSILDKENQQQVQSFLSENENFSLVTEKQFLPTKKHDGLYVALLQRN
jgi:16S rRNA (cytosine967-C5)-methyltransferase